MGGLKVIACPFLKEITGYKTESQTAEVRLPGNKRQQGEYEKTADDSHPEGHRHRYGEDKSPEVGPHY